MAKPIIQLYKAISDFKQQPFWWVVILTVLLSDVNAFGLTVKNPFRAACEFKVPQGQVSPFGLQLHTLLLPYQKKATVSWRDEVRKFKPCADSKDPKMSKIKKLIADAALLKSQGKLPEASKMFAQADALLKTVALKPFPGTSPISSTFIKDLENWWIDAGSIIDLELSRCQSDAEASAFVDGIYGPLNGWGAKQIDDMLRVASLSAQQGIDATELIASAMDLWALLYNGGNSDYDKDLKILNRIVDESVRIYLELIGNFAKDTPCPPSQKDFEKFGAIIDKAIIDIFPNGNNQNWIELLKEKMRSFMIPYLRSVAQKTTPSSPKWKELEGFAENIQADDLLNEIKLRKVSAPECYGWAGTIEYTVSWIDQMSVVNDGSGAPVCSRITGTHSTKDTVSRREIITLSGKDKNIPKATLNCRELAVINNHFENMGCYCPCGKDGHDNCDYEYTSDHINWTLETVVAANPVVSYNLSFDFLKNNVKVSFENQPVKYIRHSRNGKARYSHIRSACPGKPGDPPDYSGDTPEEGYAISDTCLFAFDPQKPDHIAGKFHLDKPKPSPFWEAYTKNLQKEVSKGGTYSYQLTIFQYDFEVDLQKVKLTK